MKITIVQGAFFPVPTLLGGAVEKIWFRLAQEFAALGHDVTHVSRSHPRLPAGEVIAGVRHHRVTGYNQPTNGLKLKALDLLYSRRACRAVPLDSDIVVTNTFWSPFLLPRALRPRAYVSVERFPKGQMKWYKTAARLRGCSLTIAKAVQKELPPDRHSQVACIPNPFPFDPPKPEERTAKIDQILYCGRVHPEKGLEILIDAAAGLKWPVLVVGPQEIRHGGGGPEYIQSMMARAKQAGADVTFMPPVFDIAELGRLYNQAAIFVYPSIAEAGEAGPVAPREAMSWGCVPVVSALDCFSDFIEPGRNGLVFDHRAANPAGELHAALERLIADQTLRQHLAAEAVKVCQTHSPEHIAHLMLADFQAALG